MRRNRFLTAVLSMAAAALLGQTALVAPADAVAHPVGPQPASQEACPTSSHGHYRCFAEYRRASRTPERTATVRAQQLPEGYGPADIASAYQLPKGGGDGMTVAIVDAADNPNVEADLAVYRATYGLPLCTTANGCFTKVNQRGGSEPPAPDVGWGIEISLDVQAVSAACPRCKILLVEADSTSFDDMGTASDTAVRLGARIVSHSYGASEDYDSPRLNREYYSQPGVAHVVSSGDSGFQTANFPAASPNAIAVGGTTLTRSEDGAWHEKAWSGAGSGCSAWFDKPKWQKDGHCPMRTTADVSAIGDGQYGFAVYDTFGFGEGSWFVLGGTSLSAPLIAAMIARAGNPGKLAGARYIYRHRSGLHDVVGGSNGYCGGDYLCTGLPGYDGPTGLGSPRGLSAL